MTKKSLAALMLAGAMMTVGSGAMAVTEPVNITNGTTEPTAGVAVTYDASEVINLTVSWDDIGEIKYTWENGVWKAPTDTPNLTFNITNKGSKSKTLTFTQEGSLDWLTAKSNTPSASVDAATPTGNGIGSVSFTLTPNVVAGVGNNKVSDGSLTFLIAVSDAAQN